MCRACLMPTTSTTHINSSISWLLFINFNSHLVYSLCLRRCTFLYHTDFFLVLKATSSRNHNVTLHFFEIKWHGVFLNKYVKAYCGITWTHTHSGNEYPCIDELFVLVETFTQALTWPANAKTTFDPLRKFG